jgi:hypothetical protein
MLKKTLNSESITNTMRRNAPSENVSVRPGFRDAHRCRRQQVIRFSDLAAHSC